MGRPQLSRDMQLLMLKLYSDGHSLATIGEKLGRAATTVRNVLIRNGVVFSSKRTRGRSVALRVAGIPVANVLDVQAQYAAADSKGKTDIYLSTMARFGLSGKRASWLVNGMNPYRITPELLAELERDRLLAYPPLEKEDREVLVDELSNIYKMLTKEGVSSAGRQAVWDLMTAIMDDNRALLKEATSASS